MSFLKLIVLSSLTLFGITHGATDIPPNRILACNLGERHEHRHAAPVL